MVRNGRFNFASNTQLFPMPTQNAALSPESLTGFTSSVLLNPDFVFDIIKANPGCHFAQIVERGNYQPAEHNQLYALLEGLVSAARIRRWESQWPSQQLHGITLYYALPDLKVADTTGEPSRQTAAVLERQDTSKFMKESLRDVLRDKDQQIAGLNAVVAELQLPVLPTLRRASIRPAFHFAYFSAEAGCWTLQDGPGWLAEFKDYRKDNHKTAGIHCRAAADALNQVGELGAALSILLRDAVPDYETNDEVIAAVARAKAALKNYSA